MKTKTYLTFSLAIILSSNLTLVHGMEKYEPERPRSAPVETCNETKYYDVTYYPATGELREERRTIGSPDSEDGSSTDSLYEYSDEDTDFGETNFFRKTIRKEEEEEEYITPEKANELSCLIRRKIQRSFSLVISEKNYRSRQFLHAFDTYLENPERLVLSKDDANNEIKLLLRKDSIEELESKIKLL